MNERIAQLAEQAAQESALLENKMNLEVTVGDNVFNIPAEFIEKFAELTVQECVKVADEPGARIPGFYIKKHFELDD